MALPDYIASSKTPEWATPQAFYDELNKEFGPFTLDPCATQENAKCARFFTKTENGLAQTWEGKVYINPPYGREIKDWVRKAAQSVRSGGGQAEICVMLLPARTDTKWWWDYIQDKAQVRFIRGRVKFRTPGQAKPAPAPFPSVIVIFR